MIITHLNIMKGILIGVNVVSVATLGKNKHECRHTHTRTRQTSAMTQECSDTGRLLPRTDTTM